MRAIFTEETTAALGTNQFTPKPFDNVKTLSPPTGNSRAYTVRRLREERLFVSGYLPQRARAAARAQRERCFAFVASIHLACAILPVSPLNEPLVGARMREARILGSECRRR